MKKRITAYIITIVTAVCMAFMVTACGKSETENNAGGKTIEGDLQEVMAQIYAGVDLDAETKEAMQGFVTDTLTSIFADFTPASFRFLIIPHPKDSGHPTPSEVNPSFP